MSLPYRVQIASPHNHGKTVVMVMDILRGAIEAGSHKIEIENITPDLNALRAQLDKAKESLRFTADFGTCWDSGLNMKGHGKCDVCVAVQTLAALEDEKKEER